MTTDGQHLSPITMLAVEFSVGGLASHVAHLVGHLPPVVVGSASALVVGALLRLADPLLKASGERVARRLTPAPPAPTTAPHTRSVLVVDDHEGVRQLLAHALRAALPGVPVHEARSGAEARGLHARHRPAAVVCDLILPDELGSDVLAGIGRAGDVLTSGVADADALDAAARRCGAVPMRKPLVPADVIAEARRMLDAATA